ncbi:hypothetical protein BG60_23780 [Caballeronia zhejiangensis]|uniref:Uncharacterized protein n=1 Tax=Caballeronia zhejiangensis TaxID=871203 RepID=A0A656QCL2_9BURK|nr:hypothetical protein BURK_009386 [Burkholderia sp. SJ98]KDR26209.1 hypothetical protein BG60_23780 [Caballeronia zhejiangensis]
MPSEIDEVAPNRFADALLIQQGASNPSGVTRTLVRAINACHRENVSTSEDAAVRLIIHQLAHICGVWEIDHVPEVYSTLTEACEARKRAC